MSVVPDIKKFAVKKFALVLGCLLAQQGVFARSDSSHPIFFQAASLQSHDILASAFSAERAMNKQNSMVASMPLADADHLRVLIANLEESGDFHSPRIAELSSELGKALQGSGEHRAALDAYDRSFQIVRRLEGLSSATQVAILQAEINSQLALGDMEASDRLQHSLFSMQQRLLAEQPIALADANQASADWNLKYYLQARQTVVIGGRTDVQDAALAQRLGDAFRQYHKALWLLSTATEDGLYNEKITVERKIAALALMVNRQQQREMPATLTKLGQHSIHQSKHANDPALFQHGSAALQRAVAYSMAAAEPVSIAERQLELADWYLLMDQHEQARAIYADAVASLRAAGIQQQQINAILESGSPVRDPEIALALAVTTGAGSDFDGYIDVAFDLNRYGKASNTRVLAGNSYDESVERALMQQIHDGRFRPDFAQDAAVDSREVTLRYYFAR